MPVNQQYELFNIIFLHFIVFVLFSRLLFVFVFAFYMPQKSVNTHKHTNVAMTITVRQKAEQRGRKQRKQLLISNKKCLLLLRLLTSPIGDGCFDSCLAVRRMGRRLHYVIIYSCRVWRSVIVCDIVVCVWCLRAHRFARLRCRHPWRQ